MNFKFAVAALVLACAFGSAGCSHNNNPQAGPPSNASTQLPQPPPYSAATTARPANSGTSGMPGNAAGADSTGAVKGMAGNTASFNALAGSKGYITQQDAQRDHPLARHFSDCDANHDGRLTLQEYEQCPQQGEGATPEGVPASGSSTH